MTIDWSNVPTEMAVLSLALVLGGIIGLERQYRHKAAGIRTHALVSLGSCVFTLISVVGFIGLADYDFVRDPSRIAAQIVSGIGFLGAGVIFVNRDVVRGLTTAASIWLSAAIGMACGAGLFPMAVFGTVLYLVTVFVLDALNRFVPQAGKRSTLVVVYEDGRGVLRVALARLAALGCHVALLSTAHTARGGREAVRAELQIRSGPPLPTVIEQLGGVSGVLAVARRSADSDPDEL